MGSQLRHFDTYGDPCQSEKGEYLWTHTKDDASCTIVWWNTSLKYLFFCENLVDFNETCLHEVILNLHRHMWIFSHLSIVSERARLEIWRSEVQIPIHIQIFLLNLNSFISVFQSLFIFSTILFLFLMVN